MAWVSNVVVEGVESGQYWIYLKDSQWDFLMGNEREKVRMAARFMV